MMNHAAATLCILLLAAGAQPAESNSDEISCRPGELRLPLTVEERSGVARRGVVVTSGAPFPAGFLNDVKKLRVIDLAGNPVPCQAKVMSRWWKPRYDGSVRWALVSFPADVSAGGSAAYYLTDNGGPTPETDLKVERTANTILISTGGARFEIPCSGESLIRRAVIGGTDVFGPSGLRGVITSGKWEEQGLSGGEKMTASFSSTGVEVEELGSVRAVVAIKGSYRPGAPATGGYYDFTARLYFTANSPSVRIVYTVRNGRLDPKLIDGKRRTYVWPIEDASLTAELALDVRVEAACLAESDTVRGDALAVYQDSSGGERWKQLGGGNYERWLAKYSDGKEVPGVRFRGYQVTSGAGIVAAGNQNPGVLSLAGHGAGIAVALRNFREEHPSSLVGSREQLRVGLFPGEFADPFWLAPGQRKCWDVRLDLFTDAPPKLEQLHAEHDVLLLFRAPPAWVAQSCAWTTPLPSVSRPSEPPSRRWDKSKLDGIDVGWDWHGWISSWNAGGAHWNQSTCFGRWVLWGDGEEFDRAESKALWAAGAAPMHFDDPELPTFWLMLRSWNWRENRLALHSFPGYYDRAVWGLPDSGHMGMFMWPEYYYLTGDMRAREACDSLGVRARAFLWQYNYDDRPDGTGPLPHAISWCSRRDPDSDPAFRLATRYVGWPLYDLACWYELTGNPLLTDECRTVARAFRNTARMSPIGFMVLQINGRGDRSVYGGQGPFDPMQSRSASQCYAHFQQGIMTTALAKYYEETGDMEALDTMIGFADLMCHHCLLKDSAGRPAGWTYTFGDYWGPYELADLPEDYRASFMVSNFRVTQPLGRIYEATGRADYLEVLEAAVNSLRGPDFTVAAALRAVSNQRADREPPAAVTDLTAEALGEGKVRLSWTDSGDDGRRGTAAWRQVKCSTARIVEQVSGWPDLTEPLPATESQWHQRAEAFNRKQRAFWAADNLEGEPAPAPAGTRQSFVVGGLKQGFHYFALKTWDDGPNMSPLSNVVKLDVK